MRVLHSLCVLILSIALNNAVVAHQSTRVVLETEMGDIVINVYTETAPKASAYFLRLIDSGAYAEASFYRSGSVDSDDAPQLIQGGMLGASLDDPEMATVGITKWMMLPDFDTTRDTGLRHEYATVSLARDLLKSGAVIPEIFITLRDSPQLDFGGRDKPDNRGFPAFGKVVEGMDVVESIAAREAAGKSAIPLLRGQVLTRAVPITQAYRSGPSER